MATILAFPAARRRGFIRKQGAWLSDLPSREAEKHLTYQLRKQRETLLSKGVHPAAVDREMAALEIAIRCEIARNIATYGGAA